MDQDQFRTPTGPSIEDITCIADPVGGNSDLDPTLDKNRS